MSKLSIICILLVIIVISVDVEGHKRGGRKNGKGKETETEVGESSEKSPGSPKKDKQQTGNAAKKGKSGRKGRRNKKRRCQCKVASVKTLSKCRKNGRRRTCSKVKQYFFTKKQCNYPFDDLNAGETDDSGSNDGPDDGTDPNDGTGSDDDTGSNDGTGSDDGNDDGAGTGGGLEVDPGETLPGDGVDDDQVDIILIGDCTDTENPEYALEKCAASIKQDPPLYYLETSCSTHFIQCGEHGGADIKPCAPETEWCQQKLTCDHVGSCNT
ncbi:protein qua-1-like isoform X6 [Mytilus trossulus]|uniref:protein qua-1-like isoform X6 n=1 Tax=Mytilus trossulus TaxID=6551 RepID=UPI003004ED8E